jgi:hypothetical protein
MKTSNWSLAGMFVGIIFSIGSFFRYYIVPVIINQGEVIETNLITTVAIGLLIIAVSWLYNKQKIQGSTLEALEDYIADKRFEDTHKE